MAKKNNNRPYYITGAIFIFIVIALVVARKMELIGGKQPIEVTFANVVKGEIIEKVSASGKVQPETEVRISPLVPGEIIDVMVQEGDSVVRGQILIRIKPDNLQSVLDRVVASLNAQKAALAQARARLEQAKAQLIRRKQELDRNRALHAQKAISDNELEQAITNYEVAEAELKSAEQSVESSRYAVLSAEAQVKEAAENLSFTTITAPMSGIITKLSVEKGERVVGTSQMAGTEMLRIADLNTMEVSVDVNENDIIRVNVGDTCVVEVDSYSFRDAKFKGLVTSIANSAKEKPGLTDAITEFEVRIRILSDSYRSLINERKGKAPFRPGMTANVEIITERKKNIIVVPLGAVTTRSDLAGGGDKASKEDAKEVVFVHKDGEVTVTEVKTGISDFDNIEIISGLQEGQQIVSGPFLAVSKLLKDKDKVKSAEEKAAKDEKK